MAFDPSSAVPVATTSGFDISSAKPATKGLLDYAKEYYGPLEAAASIASGTAASAAGGLAGVGQGLKNLVIPGGMSAADRVAQVQGAATYQPRTTTGQAITSTVAFPFEKLAQLGEYLGTTTSEATGSPAVGAGVNTAVQSIPLAISPVASRLKVPARIQEPLASNIAAARESGFSVTPHEGGAGILGNAAAGLAGEPKLARKISSNNQPIYNQKIAEDLGLPKDTILTREKLKEVRDEAGLKYDVVKSTGTVRTDPIYQQDISKISSSYDMAARDFAHRSENPFQKTMDGLQVKQFDAANAVEEVKLLRADADKAYRNGDPALGKAFKSAAQALDDQLARHVKSVGKDPKMVSEYLEARTRIAKSYAADEALNPTTGNINPASYARRLKKGSPLTGGAREVAEFASAFPRSSQNVAGKSPGDGPTFFDAAMGGLAHDWLIPFARPIARTVLANEPYQSLLTTEMLRPSLNNMLQIQGNPAIGLAEIAAAQRKKE